MRTSRGRDRLRRWYLCALPYRMFKKALLNKSKMYCLKMKSILWSSSNLAMQIFYIWLRLMCARASRTRDSTTLVRVCLAVSNVNARHAAKRQQFGQLAPATTGQPQDWRTLGRGRLNEIMRFASLGFIAVHRDIHAHMLLAS